jgi:hypothetical protein
MAKIIDFQAFFFARRRSFHMTCFPFVKKRNHEWNHMFVVLSFDVGLVGEKLLEAKGLENIDFSP